MIWCENFIEYYDVQQNSASFIVLTLEHVKNQVYFNGGVFFMKKNTRIFSILLAFVMFVSMMSVGVSAAHTAYDTPGGYNTLGKPYLTLDQCGSALLDYIDASLREADITIYYDIVITTIDLKFTSIDNTLNSLDDLINDSFYGFVTKLDVGDLNDLSEYWIENCPRRTDVGTTDMQVLYGLCNFLHDNKTIIGKVVDGSFSLGIVDSFYNINDAIGDISAKIKGMIYGILFDEDVYGAMPDGMTIDQMINQKLNYLLVSDPVEGEGMLPSMEGKINVNSGSTYSFLRNTINALLTDMVIPMLVDLLVDTFDIVIDETHPDGYYDGTSSLDIVWKIIFKSGDAEEGGDTGEGEELGGGALGALLGGLVEVPAELDGKAVPMLNYALNYILMENPGFLGTYITRTEQGIGLAPGFDAAMGELLTILSNLMPMLNLNGITLKSEEEIAAMTTAQKFSYIGKMVCIGLIDFTVIPDNVQTLRETATYLLISYCANILPDIDYLSRIDYSVTTSTYNAINPSTDGALMVSAGLIRYYLNANTEMNIPEGLTFNGTIEYMLNWAIAKFGGVIYTGGMESDTVWKKLDKILFGESPLLCGILQSSWLPTTVDRTNMTYDILFNKIIFAILDFNFTETTGLFSLFQKNDTGELNEPISNVVLSFVARLINGIFENTTIISTETENFESLFTNSQLRTIVVALLEALPTYIEAICVSVLPLVVPLMGIVDMSQFDIAAPPGAATYTAVQLRNLLDRQVPKEQDIMYDEDGYVFFGVENYTPEYKYYDYMDARSEAEAVLSDYDEYMANKDDPEWVGKTVTIADISKVAYRVNYYYNQLVSRTTLNVARLYDVMEVYDISTFDSSEYSLRSWHNLERAWAFAESVYQDVMFNLNSFSNMSQTMIAEARSQLVSAVKSLKPWAASADYTVLDTAIVNAERYVAEASRYFDDCASVLINIYNKALEIPTDYDLNDQDLINNMIEALQGAIDGLVYIPAVISVDTTNTILDETRKIVFGLDQGMYTVFSHVANVGAGAIEVIDNGKGFSTVGTNTTINLVLNGEIIDTYKVVIFGDVDGDGFADGNDAFIVSQLTNRVITEDDLGTEYTYAADADGDNNVDDLDVDTLVDAGMFKTTIAQDHELV